MLHAMRQFRYAVRFVPNPDPLNTMTAESARNEVFKLWNFHDVVKEYKHNLPLEFAIEWLKTETPEDFDPHEYLSLF